METTPKFIDEVFALPTSQDWQSKLARCLGREMSGLRNIGGSTDWRNSARDVIDQLLLTRKGELTQATIYPYELAPAHFTPELHARLRELCFSSSLVREARTAFFCGVPVWRQRGVELLRSLLHTDEIQPDADRAADAAIAYAKEAA